MLENQRENCQAKKPNFRSAKLPKADAKTEKNHLRQTIYEKEISAFNILFRDFLRYRVNHIKASFTICKYFSNSSQIPFELSQVDCLNIRQDQEKWTMVDVPGDGNCWMYATLISGLYSSGTRVRMNPQECRENISDLLMRVPRLSNKEITVFL